MEPKRFSIKGSITAVLLALPLLVTGQNQSAVDYPFIYHYNVSDWGEYHSFVPTPKDIVPIPLYELPDEMTIKTTEDVQEEVLVSLVKSYLPDARFYWPRKDSHEYCMVSTESGTIDEAIKNLLDEDIVLSARHNYIRRSYLEYIEFCPVNEVATYGFTNEIQIQHLNYEVFPAAKALIESLGLQIIYNEYNNIWASVAVPKTTDVISVANKLYESGYFLIARPNPVYGHKTFEVQPIEESSLPFYYNMDGEKTYIYVSPFRFMVSKRPETEKSVIESTVRKYAADAEIKWYEENRCSVSTAPRQMGALMESLKHEEAVLDIGNRYMWISEYARLLNTGLGDIIQDFYFDGKVFLQFKDDVPDDVRNSIIQEYNLSHVPGNPNAYDEWLSQYWYELPATSDVLSVCNSIFETGYVDYAVANRKYYKEYHAELLGPDSETGISETDIKVQETGKQYFDLLGRRKDSPIGLTIVVTRFSDGSVRTEKKLF